jgi:predicted alpha/beta-fold hydrolase
MTVAPAFWPRRNPLLKSVLAGAQERLFQVEDNVSVLTRCHWQPDPKSRPTLLLVHGLEGSAESSYVVGITFKAFHQGFNVIRMNLRNCGGSMHLTHTLYNGGLSADVIHILRELHAEGLPPAFIAGCSLGGNIVLKAAGELGLEGPSMLAGVVAISPSLDLDRCVQALESPANRLYELWFLHTLKRKIREKAVTHPQHYDVTKLANVNSMRSFDDTFTAPAGGYGTAANYYDKASSIRVLHKIAVPTLIIASEDDPLIPFELFASVMHDNDNVALLATKYGGHAGYIHHASERLPVFDCFWAENRVVDFCQEVGNQRLSCSM